MIKRSFFLIAMTLLSLCTRAQKVIQMEKEGGVYKISCTVNGARMKMIFDTGAAAVSLSMAMANYLYENDYIKKEDIVGKGKSQTADGTIVDHVVINLRDIEISELHIKNIKATVIAGQNAPLLLGQTAIQALGPVTIEGNKLIINNYKNKTLSEQEIDRLEKEADSFYENEQYYASADAYTKLNNYPGLTTLGVFRLINSCIHIGQYDKAIDYVIEWENGEDFSEAEEEMKSCIYGIAAIACRSLEDYKSVITFMEKQITCQQKCGEEINGIDFDNIADAYMKLGNKDASIQYRKKAINKLLSEAGFSIIDLYNGKISNSYVKNVVGSSLAGYALTISDINVDTITEQEKYLWIGAAKCGEEIALDICKGFNYDYKNVMYDRKYNYLFSLY